MAISAKLLEFNIKNKLEERGKTGRKSTKNRRKQDDTERNRKQQEAAGRTKKKR